MSKEIIPSSLFIDISSLIETAKHHVSQEFNSIYVMLAWNIGTRIGQEILDHKRDDYGKFIMNDLANELRLKYGQGFDKFSLFN
jgi:hypothetical protein